MRDVADFMNRTKKKLLDKGIGDTKVWDRFEIIIGDGFLPPKRIEEGKIALVPCDDLQGACHA